MHVGASISGFSAAVSGSGQVFMHCFMVPAQLFRHTLIAALPVTRLSREPSGLGGGPSGSVLAALRPGGNAIARLSADEIINNAVILLITVLYILFAVDVPLMNVPVL